MTVYVLAVCSSKGVIRMEQAELESEEGGVALWMSTCPTTSLFVILSHCTNRVCFFLLQL